MTDKSRHLSVPRISPQAITGKETAAEQIDQAFMAYNGALLREVATLLTGLILEPDVTVSLSLTGALTTAGLVMIAINTQLIARIPITSWGTWSGSGRIWVFIAMARRDASPVPRRPHRTFAGLACLLEGARARALPDRYGRSVDTRSTE